jgi:hypothetical protein
MKHILDAFCIGFAFFYTGYTVKGVVDYLRIKRTQKEWRHWMKYHDQIDYARRERK